MVVLAYLFEVEIALYLPTQRERVCFEYRKMKQKGETTSLCFLPYLGPSGRHRDQGHEGHQAPHFLNLKNHSLKGSL